MVPHFLTRKLNFESKTDFFDSKIEKKISRKRLFKQKSSNKKEYFLLFFVHFSVQKALFRASRALSWKS